MLLTLLQLAAVPTEPATSSNAIDFTLLFIKMMAALVVACVAAVLVLKYAVPRLGLTRRLEANKYIRILARVPLGPKQYLYLVEVSGKQLLLGATDHGITKLADVDEDEK